MLWFFVALTAVAVVVIGLIAVGRVTLTLAAEPPRTVFDLDEAVEYVADRLPDEVTAQVSYDDVRAVISWHLDYLEARGVAREDTEPDSTEGFCAPEVEAWEDQGGPLVADEDEALAYVLGCAGDAGCEVDDTHVVAILDADESYLRAIGAVGLEVPGPEDPAGS